MGKLFKLAVEELVTQDPTIAGKINVSEAIRNAEDLAKTDSEIQQDIQAMEELMEERQVLQQQADTNDALLENPDAVVTVADVEVSEETRNEIYYYLGYKSNVDKIRLSSESMYKEVRSNPRKYLNISNESIKDTIKKIWEKIKAFFKKIADKIRSFFRKKKASDEKEKIKELKGELISVKHFKTKYTLSDSYLKSLSVRFPFYAILITTASKENTTFEVGEITQPLAYKRQMDLINNFIRDTYTTLLYDGEKHRNTLNSSLNLLSCIENDFDSLIENLCKESPFAYLMKNQKFVLELKSNMEPRDEILTILYVTNTSICYIPKYFNRGTLEDIVKTAHFAYNINLVNDRDVTLNITHSNIEFMLDNLNKTADLVPNVANDILKEREKLFSDIEKKYSNLNTATIEGSNSNDISKYARLINRTIGNPSIVTNMIMDLSQFRDISIYACSELLKNIKKEEVQI